jgi:hypothetical protein
MPNRIEQKIARARELLAEIHHVSIATVNADGSPHNSPVFMAFDEQLNGYWSSHQDSLHSRNIVRTGRSFLAIFDGREGHGGLFIETDASVLEEALDIRRALEVLRPVKEAMYGTMGEPETYLSPGPQRIYQAKPRRFWVNVSDRDQQGAIIRDERYEISLKDLHIE